MASLEFFIRKFGAREGKKKYNNYHKQYRKLHAARLAAYARDRRQAKKSVFMRLPWRSNPPTVS